MGVRSLASKVAELNQAAAAGGPLNGAKVGLIAGPLQPTDATVMGDITEPTYPGYAQKPVANWTAAFVGSNGIPQIDGGDFLFQMNDSSTPTVIYGFFIATGAAPEVLVETWMFQAAIALNGPLDGVVADVVSMYGD
jgi:hypothetical protein